MEISGLLYGELDLIAPRSTVGEPSALSIADSDEDKVGVLRCASEGESNGPGAERGVAVGCTDTLDDASGCSGATFSRPGMWLLRAGAMEGSESR